MLLVSKLLNEVHTLGSSNVYLAIYNTSMLQFLKQNNFWSNLGNKPNNMYTVY